MSARMLAVAAARVPGRFIRADAQRLPLPDAITGVAVTAVTLEFVYPAAVLAELARITRPGGPHRRIYPQPEQPLGIARLEMGRAGCEIVIVHAEATRHLLHAHSAIRDLGARAGMALSPATPLQAVTNVLHLTDLLLVMTVYPGFGGQQYLAAMEPKIAAARAEIDRRGLEVELEVDGGINAATIGAAARAGATVFCAGSAPAHASAPLSARAGI